MIQKAIFLAMIGVLCVVAVSFVDIISPRELTSNAIGESFYRIHLHAKTHSELPQTIADFPERDGYANRTTDAWGRELSYEISESGLITLSSLGADGKTGGTGDDADISTSYHSTDAEGRFIAGDDLWIVDGAVRSND